jgi:hypothetical protein
MEWMLVIPFITAGLGDPVHIAVDEFETEAECVAAINAPLEQSVTTGLAREGIAGLTPYCVSHSEEAEKRDARADKACADWWQWWETDTSWLFRLISHEPECPNPETLSN